MGILISLKQPVFKCETHISRNPPYPLELRKLEVVGER
jgi:hypothetical protein